jgi:PAS domain S-box-containing protein
MHNHFSKEIKLSNIKPILSRTDLTGKIQYINPYFSEVSGYTEDELIGAPHNIIRHPDMPKVIFKLMWDRLKNNQNILALVKNMTKNGDYYWVTTLFETKYNPFDKTPESYLALRKAAPKNAVVAIEPLYRELIIIESRGGIEASEEFLMNMLREKDISYDEFMEDLVQYKGLVAKFFNGMKKLFT